MNVSGRRYAASVSRIRATLAALAVAVLATACTPAATTAAGHDLKKANVTGTTRCAYRDGGRLPDPHCTPGSINPAVTQADIRSTICRKGWTRTVRQPEKVTERYKYGVSYPAYGLPGNERAVLDDLIPLEVGGRSAPANWWPQQRQSSYVKDKVEDVLNHAVCSGRVTLAAAQAAIASDWLTAEKKLGL